MSRWANMTDAQRIRAVERNSQWAKANRDKCRATQKKSRAAHPLTSEERERKRQYRKAKYHERKLDPLWWAKETERKKLLMRKRRATDPIMRVLDEKHRERAKIRKGKYPVEATVEEYLKQGVKDRSGICPKFNDPGRRGAPDRLVCLPGHPTYFVELKRPNIGVLDSHQVRYHESLRAAGQKVWVLWSKEDVDAFLTAL